MTFPGSIVNHFRGSKSTRTAGQVLKVEPMGKQAALNQNTAWQVIHLGDSFWAHYEIQGYRNAAITIAALVAAIAILL